MTKVFTDTTPCQIGSIAMPPIEVPPRLPTSIPISETYQSRGRLRISPRTMASPVWIELSIRIIRNTRPGSTPIAFITPNSRTRSNTAINMALITVMAMAM